MNIKDAAAAEPKHAHAIAGDRGGAATPTTPRLRRRPILIGVAALAAVAVAVAGYWFCCLRGIVYTDDARFGGHVVDLAPEINGRLVEIAFREGQSVRRGQPVFRLDPASARAALHQAEASLQSAEANIDATQARYEKALHGNRPEEIRAAEATFKRLQNEEELARLSYQRADVLVRGGAAAQDDLDRTRTAYESARQSRETAAQNLELLRRGARTEDVAAARADVALARAHAAEAAAAVDRARADLDHCTVMSPFDGFVVRRWLDPGAITPPSQPVVSLFDPATLRVDANVEEKYLHEVQVGDEADIAVDAFPGLRLKGRVTDILRATNSEFSLIPAEGVSGTFIKVTQRVPLRISVTAPAGLPLGPGLSVEVRIHVGTAPRPRDQPAAHAGS